MHPLRVHRHRYCSRRVLNLVSSVALLSVLASVSPAVAQLTITVNTLVDKADPPFNGFNPSINVCGTNLATAPLPATRSLREAIIFANKNSGTETIKFAPALAGGTINVSFDGPDPDALPTTLPRLCGGVTIDGDVNSDGVPDVTINGGSVVGGGLGMLKNTNAVKRLRVRGFSGTQIFVFPRADFSTESLGNVIEGNIVNGGSFGIIVQASYGTNTEIGTVRNTTVTKNTVSGATFDGIFVLTGNTAGTLIDGTQILNNTVSANKRYGIFVLANVNPSPGSTAGTTTSITNTLIRGNEVFNNGDAATSGSGVGIFAQAYLGKSNTISGLTINANNVHDNLSTGVTVIGGVCGATLNTLSTTISQNVVTNNGPSNGTSGIGVFGGSNFGCLGTPAVVSQNTVSAQVVDNIVTDNRGSGIGIGGGVINATLNTVTASVLRNSVLRNGLQGISVFGGIATFGGSTSSATSNKVNLVVSQNTVEWNKNFGVILTAGNAGPASTNTILNTQVTNNRVCHNTLVDIGAVGGSLAFNSLPANSGIGNQTTGALTGNTANFITVVNGTAGNVALFTQANNDRCDKRLVGDFNGDGRKDLLFVSTLGVVSVWLSNGSAAAPTVGTLGTLPAGTTIAGLGTFNADTRTDILLRSATGLSVWFLNAGGVTITPGAALALDASWAVVGLGNINADARTDIVLRRNTGTVAVRLDNGPSITSGALPVIDPSFGVVGLRDISGEGRADLLLRQSTTGIVRAWLLNGVVAPTIGNLGTLDSTWSVEGLADINGDAKPDLVARQVGGTIRAWLLNGLGAPTTGPLGTLNISSNIEALANISAGDARADLIFRNTAGQISAWLLNGLAVPTSGILGAPGTAWTIGGVTDLTNDARSDLVFRHSGGSVVAWFLNGLTTPPPSRVLGSASPSALKIPRPQQ